MRGIAALTVVALHAMAIFKIPFVMNAALSVDFFFCLSGFVIAHAYDKRIGSSLSTIGFMKLRLIRLYPMLFLSTIFGFVVACVRQASGPSVGDPLWLAAAGLAMIPVFVSPLAYPLNFPAWSLFFEFVASLFYGLERRKLSNRLLAIGSLASGALLLVLIGLAGHIETFGVGGKSFMFGFVRVSYPFLVGMLISRTEVWRHAPRLPALLLAFALAVILLAPIKSWQFDAVIVLVVMPLLVVVGSRAQTRALTAVWSFMGRLSYPVYVIHAVVLEATLIALHGHLAPMAAAGVGFALSVAAAYLALLAFDEPVRQGLRRPMVRPAIVAP